LAGKVEKSAPKGRFLAGKAGKTPFLGGNSAFSGDFGSKSAVFAALQAAFEGNEIADAVAAAAVAEVMGGVS
jgi:hypothetical protein